MSIREADDQFAWRGPAAAQHRFSLFLYLKEAIIPPKGHKVVPTTSGLFLVFIGLSLGLAAYNTENNILFAALSLLLASIVLSGIVSWLNFSSARWRIDASATLRVGEEAEIFVHLENARKRFPLTCLMFELSFGDSEIETQRVYLEKALEPGEETKLVWRYKPTRRMRARIGIVDVSSSFPFGFLRKHIAGESSKEVLVWPERIDYIRGTLEKGHAAYRGLSTRIKGMTGEIMAMREYVPGDAPRSIHWKVSARQGRLMVKQNSQESQPFYSVTIDPSRFLWNSEVAFEKMCSFAASLSEDLFLEGKLSHCRVLGGFEIETRRVSDLEAFFDELSGIRPADAATVGVSGISWQNSLRFEPSVGGSIIASLNGSKFAQA